MAEEKAVYEVAPAKENPNEKVITLSDGRVCVIRKGKGKDAVEAMKVAGTDSSNFIFALMSRVTTIDGNPIVMEDLEELPLPDVMHMQEVFSQINFLSVGGK